MADERVNRERELFWTRVTVAVAVLAFLVSAYGVIDQHQIAVSSQADAERLTRALESTQTALTNAQAENEALSSVSLDTFLQQYNKHMERLQKASDAYEKAKSAKGANIPGSDAAGALARAEQDLNDVSDSFTDFTRLWHDVAQIFAKMLDGNTQELEDLRRQHNADGVDAAARRIVRSAPDLAPALRVALDNVRPHKPVKK